MVRVERDRPFPDMPPDTLNDAVLDSAIFQADLRTCGVARLSRVSIPSGIARSRKGRCNSPMGGPTRRRIFGDRVSGAKISAVFARERARKAAREADAAECLLWSEQMEGFGGPAQPSPTIAQCLNGGYRWLGACPNSGCSTLSESGSSLGS